MKILGMFFSLIGRNPLLFAYGIVLAALTWKVAEVEVLKGKVVKAHTAADSLQLDAMNERAANNAVVSYLRDSLTRVSQKAVVQRRPSRDTAVTAAIVAQVAPVAGEVAVDTVGLSVIPIGDTGDSAYVRTYEFRLDARPVHGFVWADVIELSPHARLRYDLEFEPARLRAHIVCGLPQPPRNIKPVTLSLEGPPWLRVDSMAVFATPGACNPPPPQIKRRGVPLWTAIPALALTFLIGKAL